jgi:transcriptional regulator with XRE-family HTH domain
MGNINITVGNNIKKERQKKRLSQESLAELAGLHRTYIGIIERAERNITITSLEKITKALNINISDIFNE